MNPDRHASFLTAVLGADGASALAKASERSTDLGKVLWPRTILAWLNTVRDDFDGELPGVDNIALQFTKSETGYSGSISIGEQTYRLEKASVFQMVASVAVALDLDKEPPPAGIKDLDLERLGKSIDLMVRSRAVSQQLAKGEKAECSKCGQQTYQTGDKIGFHSVKGKKCPGSGEAPKLEKEELEKAKPTGPGTGMAHAPEAPDAPEPPTSVAPQAAAPKPKMPKPATAKPAKPVSSYTLKLSQSEAQRPCPECGFEQFRGEMFRGCICMHDLAKSAVVVAYEPEGIILELNAQEWGQDEIRTFLESIGRRR